MELLEVLLLEALGYLLRCVTQSQEVVAGVDFAYLTCPLWEGLRGLSCPYMRYMADPQQEQNCYPYQQYSPFYPTTEQFLPEGVGTGSGGEFHHRPNSGPSQQLALQQTNHQPSHLYPPSSFPMGSLKHEPEDYDMAGYNPLYNGSPGFPGYSDIDRYKLERKRERNRIAATKCRMRKMERIAQLDQEVAELKSQNTMLGQVGERLRAEVHTLRTRLKEHVGSGCQVDCSSLGQSNKTGPDSTCQ